jgi:hypothetical protein
MNTSQSSEDESNDEYDLQMAYDELYKEFMKLLNFYKISLKKLKDVKHEKESLVTKLSESNTLVESLKSGNTVFVENIKSLENDLKDSKELSNKLSSNNLKNMLCVQKDVSNKPSMIVDDLDASSSCASNSEIKSLFVKPVKVEEIKVNIACLATGKNSCMNNCVKPKSKANLGKQTQAKFVPTCYRCRIVGHIRLNSCQLKSQRPWNKEKDVAEPSMFKYVHPHRRQHSQRFVPTCHHCGKIGHTGLTV